MVLTSVFGEAMISTSANWGVSSSFKALRMPWLSSTTSIFPFLIPLSFFQWLQGIYQHIDSWWWINECSKSLCPSSCKWHIGHERLLVSRKQYTFFIILLKRRQTADAFRAAQFCLLLSMMKEQPQLKTWIGTEQCCIRYLFNLWSIDDTSRSYIRNVWSVFVWT